MSCSSIVEESFGCTDDGKPVSAFILKNKRGVIVRVINFGAIIQSIILPLKCGPLDIVLGYEDYQSYQLDKHYLGATVGRVAGKTKPTKFKLGKQCICLTANFAGDIHLHGGCRGFSKVMWDARIVGNTLSMKYCSPAGEEGYPGNLTITACFILTEDNSLCVNYKAQTDALTIINVGNHTYFNLAGHNAGAASLLQHQLLLEADEYTRLCNGVATGDRIGVECTGYDFREKRMICEAMTQITDDGFDTNYCLKPIGNCLKLAAILYYKPLCLALEVHTTAPAIQLYTSNNIDKLCGKDCSTYNKYGGVVLQSQGYPNAANIKSFPPIELCPGDEYKHQILYKFKF